jgi:hypothetical protein
MGPEELANPVDRALLQFRRLTPRKDSDFRHYVAQATGLDVPRGVLMFLVCSTNRSAPDGAALPVVRGGALT